MKTKAEQNIKKYSQLSHDAFNDVVLYEFLIAIRDKNPIGLYLDDEVLTTLENAQLVTCDNYEPHSYKEWAESTNITEMAHEVIFDYEYEHKPRK